MPVKPVIDIDIDTAKLQKFTELFDKYKAQLEKTPAAWANVNKQHAVGAKQAAFITAALLAQNQLMSKTTHQQQQQVKHTYAQQSMWQSIYKTTKGVAGTTATIAGNIAHATLSLLKWTEVIAGVGGLLGAGGLWGIDRLAASVGEQRRASGALGMSIGQKKAFSINFGSFGDPDSFLGSVNEAVTDISKQGGIRALGVVPNGSTSDTALAVMRALYNKVRRTPDDQLGLLGKQFNLGGLGDVGLLQNLKRESPAAFNERFSAYGRDRSTLNVDDQVAEGWQRFSNQLDRASGTLQRTFVYGLNGLIPAFTHLSNALTGLVQNALRKDGPVARGIDTIGHWIDDLSKYLDSDDFNKNLKSFSKGLDELGQTMHKWAHPFDTVGNAVGGAAFDVFHDDGVHRNKNIFQQGWDALMGLGKSARVSALESKYGLPVGALDYIWGKESSRGTNSVDRPGPDGAQGDFQIKGTMAGGADRHNFDQASERAAQILAADLVRYKGDIAKAIAAYHLGDTAADKLFKDPNWRNRDPYSQDWKTQTPNGIEVHLFNNTGGAVQAIVNALQVAGGL